MCDSATAGFFHLVSRSFMESSGGGGENSRHNFLGEGSRTQALGYKILLNLHRWKLGERGIDVNTLVEVKGVLPFDIRLIQSS